MSNERFPSEINIEAKESAMLNQINKNDDAVSAAPFDENEPIMAKASSTLDKTKIKNYALNNYKNPKPGRSGVPYGDFRSNGGDCTNFVSHALLAGGSNNEGR